MTLAFLGGNDKVFHAITVANTAFLLFIFWALLTEIKKGVKAGDAVWIAIYGILPEWLRKMLKYDGP